MSVGDLAGRTIHVTNIDEIQLRDKEVILTFDDGPAPGRTEAILKTLDRYNVKATFFMVGRMAKARPDLVAKVVDRGHTVGNHTYRHPNLAARGFQPAVTEINQGEVALREVGGGDPKFFRFPYLADTRALRNHLASEGTVVVDVDVDSLDYLPGSASRVVSRIMGKLKRKKKGVILMHDLHGRTVRALPSLLQQLKAGGYRVVHLKHGNGGFFLASVSSDAAGWVKTER